MALKPQIPSWQLEAEALSIEDREELIKTPRPDYTDEYRYMVHLVATNLDTRHKKKLKQEAIKNGTDNQQLTQQMYEAQIQKNQADFEKLAILRIQVGFLGASGQEQQQALDALAASGQEQWQALDSLREEVASISEQVNTIRAEMPIIRAEVADLRRESAEEERADREFNASARQELQTIRQGHREILLRFEERMQAVSLRVVNSVNSRLEEVALSQQSMRMEVNRIWALLFALQNNDLRPREPEATNWVQRTPSDRNNRGDNNGRGLEGQ